ncbi:hypothetical protein ACF07Q_21830 [Nocardiopsis dassonvillei]|uniref:hypothetical protein n=1 Tax=Nocardiopsis dassonvillei TaxID=2014 RepID=UPI003702376B
MSSMDTTIKVPRRLRDRISARAQREHVTLATAIEQALDASEELEFWADVRRHHQGLSEEERRSHLSDRTLGDDLTDADDDALTDEGAW